MPPEYFSKYFFQLLSKKEAFRDGCGSSDEKRRLSGMVVTCLFNSSSK